MYRSLWCKLGANLKRTAAIINGESSSSSSTLAAKYFLFRIQNQNVVAISKSRVTSVYNSFSTTTASDGNLATSSSSSDSSSFVISYLINSCGLSEKQAITAHGKLNFKTTSNPDSVLALLKAEGFTEPQITKMISNCPSILSYKPDKTLIPKLDFFKSKGFSGLDLANFISNDPSFLKHSFNKVIIPSFDILKSIVQSDENVIKMIKRNHWTLSANRIKRLTVNLELLRKEGVPATNVSKYLIQQPRAFAGDADRFKEIVDKVKDMGFNHLQTTFLKGIIGLTAMSKANWKNKMDVYKRWGWSEDHIQSAFRKYPDCMVASEKKIMGIMNLLVNGMGYNSLSISTTPVVFGYSLKERIIPRCSVIRILISRGLIRETICINSLLTVVDKSFLEKFVNKYEQEVPEIMKVFQCQLNYQDLLQR